LWEYYCLLAEALDAEELEEYNEAVLTAIAFHNPKKLKNWKWASADKAGTVRTGRQGVAETIANVVWEHTKGDIRPTGQAEEFARVTGRPLAYMDKAGNLFDAEGNPTERTPLTIIVRMETQ